MDTIEVKKQRLIWIDMLKGAGALTIVLAHTHRPALLFKLICGVQLPLFFMVSGYLWKRKPIQTHLRRMILPYFVLCAINLALDSGARFLKNDEIPIARYIIGILYSRGTREWTPNCSPLWAVTAFFCALAIFELIQKVNKESVKTILIIASGAVSGLLSFFEVFKLPWNIDSALMGVVFVWAGYKIKRLDILDKVKKMPNAKQVLILALSGLVGLFSIFSNPVVNVSFDNNRYGNVFLMIVGALTTVFVLFNLFYRIPWGGKTAKYVSFWGRHTIFIMGFDFFVWNIAEIMLKIIGFNHWVLEYILKLVILSVGCLMWNWCIGKIRNESIRKVLSV